MGIPRYILIDDWYTAKPTLLFYYFVFTMHAVLWGWIGGWYALNQNDVSELGSCMHAGCNICELSVLDQ